MVKNILTFLYRTLFFIVMYILIQIPTLAEVLWRNESRNYVNFLNHIVLFTIPSVLLLIIMFFSLYRFSNKHFPSNIPINSKGIFLATIVTIISQFFQYLISIFNNSDSIDYDIINSLKSPIWLITILTVIIISPILEEFLYQGILQNIFLEKLNPYLNIILTALIFALSHGYSLSLSTLELFISGLAYAFIFFKTKDLKMSIYSHSLSNIIVMIMDLML